MYDHYYLFVCCSIFVYTVNIDYVWIKSYVQISGTLEA